MSEIACFICFFFLSFTNAPRLFVFEMDSTRKVFRGSWPPACLLTAVVHTALFLSGAPSPGESAAPDSLSCLGWGPMLLLPYCLHSPPLAGGRSSPCWVPLPSGGPESSPGTHETVCLSTVAFLSRMAVKQKMD